MQFLQLILCMVHHRTLGIFKNKILAWVQKERKNKFLVRYYDKDRHIRNNEDILACPVLCPKWWLIRGIRTSKSFSTIHPIAWVDLQIAGFNLSKNENKTEFMVRIDNRIWLHNMSNCRANFTGARESLERLLTLYYSKERKLTTGSGASSCLHITQGTPVCCPTAMAAAQRT